MTYRRLVIALSVAALALSAANGVAAPSASPALREAQELSSVWGRCATARPAHRALTLAEKPAAKRVRVTRANRALGAWQRVIVECSAPIDLPVAQPGA
jgi:hypothetical protein